MSGSKPRRPMPNRSRGCPSAISTTTSRPSSSAATTGPRHGPWMTGEIPCYPVGRGYSRGTTARAFVSFRGEPCDARADRQLQIRSGARSCTTGQDWANDLDHRIRPASALGLIAALAAMMASGIWCLRCGVGCRAGRCGGWRRLWSSQPWRAGVSAGGSRAAVGYRAAFGG